MQKKLIAIVSILSAAALLFGCITPLQEYQPKSPEEEAIKKVLVNSESAWNNNDMQKYLTVLHDRGEFMYGKDRYVVSKQEFAERIAEIRAVKSRFKFGIPHITVTGDKAVVRLVDYSIPGGWPWTVHLVREDEIWYIMRNEYPAP